MMAPPLSVALQYIRHVEAALTGDDRHRYDEFCRILKQFRRRNIHSSSVVSTVQTLFQNHPALLDAFNTFKPRNCSAAAPAAQRSDVVANVDFMNRVRDRFRCGRVYTEFLNCMHAYYVRQEMSVSELCDKVVRLFGNYDHLAEEFEAQYLPRSCNRERSKRKMIDDDQIQTEFRLQGPVKKMKDLIFDSSFGFLAVSSDERAAEAKKTNDNMEDLLCLFDVRIGNLESSRENAQHLAELLSHGLVSAADVRVEDHFTPLNLSCIRRLDRKILEYLARDVEQALPELLEILTKKKEGLEKRRVKIMLQWNIFRQSCVDIL